MKCHFGPCPPCNKKDVTARCRCGKVRQQLPCSQVWIDGKQLVLDCNEDCKIGPPLPSETPETCIETGESSAAVEAASAVPDVAELRERRKDKRQKRDEELEERRLQQEAEEKRKLRRKQCRNAAMGLWALIMVGLLVFFVKLLRDQSKDSEEELRARSEWRMEPGPRQGKGGRG